MANSPTVTSLPITALGASHAPNETHCLDVRDLHVHYGNICALAEVTFSIGCGHCVGLLGQNGAGKSTLMKCIAGLISPVKGTIRWRGQAVPLVRREIAYLPQTNDEDTLFPLTVQGLVEMGRYPHLGNLKAWRPHDSEIVETAIQTLQLDPLRHRRLYQLSGGQRQRAHIARALAQEAHIFLFDEPFAGLDEPSQRMLASVLHDLAANGRLLLVCHHDLKAVPELFDTVLMLNRKLVRFGPVAETFTPDALHEVFDQAPEDVHV